jgi:hypothetical protein
MHSIPVPGCPTRSLLEAPAQDKDVFGLLTLKASVGRGGCVRSCMKAVRHFRMSANTYLCARRRVQSNKSSFHCMHGAAKLATHYYILHNDLLLKTRQRACHGFWAANGTTCCQLDMQSQIAADQPVGVPRTAQLCDGRTMALRVQKKGFEKAVRQGQHHIRGICGALGGGRPAPLTGVGTARPVCDTSHIPRAYRIPAEAVVSDC